MKDWLIACELATALACNIMALFWGVQWAILGVLWLILAEITDGRKR